MPLYQPISSPHTRNWTTSKSLGIVATLPSWLIFYKNFFHGLPPQPAGDNGTIVCISQSLKAIYILEPLDQDIASYIMGVMLESNPVEGRQDVPASSPIGLKYGHSVADACIPVLDRLRECSCSRGGFLRFFRSPALIRPGASRLATSPRPSQLEARASAFLILLHLVQESLFFENTCSLTLQS